MNTDQVTDVFLPESNAADSHIWGSVKAVNSDGSYQVQLNTSSVTTRCAAGCTAGVGDRVLVCIMANGRCVAVSRLEGDYADFKKETAFQKIVNFFGNLYLANSKYLHTRNADGAARNAIGMNSYNNLLVGYGLYDSGEGATVIYGGDYVNVLSKGGNGINTLTGGVSFAEGDDLNDYTTVGNYCSSNSTLSSTLVNTPYTGGSLGLKVMCPYGMNVSGMNVIVQEVTTTLGRHYIRRSGDKGATWSTWRRVYGETILYNNTSGTNGTVTLSESAANFTYLEIFVKTNDGDCYSTRVYSPNGKYVSLVGGRAGNDGTTYLKSKLVNISGTSITPSRYSYLYIENGSDSCYSEKSDGTYIVRVVGHV